MGTLSKLLNNHCYQCVYLHKSTVSNGVYQQQIIMFCKDSRKICIPIYFTFTEFGFSLGFACSYLHTLLLLVYLTYVFTYNPSTWDTLPVYNAPGSYILPSRWYSTFVTCRAKFSSCCCFFLLWFTWDDPVNKEISRLILRGSRDQQLNIPSDPKDTVENLLLNFWGKRGIIYISAASGTGTLDLSIHSPMLYVNNRPPATPKSCRVI